MSGKLSFRYSLNSLSKVNMMIGMKPNPSNVSSNLAPWQQRVLDELAQLTERLDKLATYLQSDSYSQLSEEDQRLLSDQAEVMVAYQAILQARIDSWSKAAEPTEQNPG